MQLKVNEVHLGCTSKNLLKTMVCVHLSFMYRDTVNNSFTLLCMSNNFSKCTLRYGTRFFFFSHYSMCINSIDDTQNFVKRLKYIFVYWWKLLKVNFQVCNFFFRIKLNFLFYGLLIAKTDKYHKKCPAVFYNTSE